MFIKIKKGIKTPPLLFQRTWDEDRHYKRMVEAGVFQSVKPESAKPDWVADYEKEIDQAISAQK